MASIPHTALQCNLSPREWPLFWSLPRAKIGIAIRRGDLARRCEEYSPSLTSYCCLLQQFLQRLKITRRCLVLTATSTIASSYLIVRTKHALYIGLNEIICSGGYSQYDDPINNPQYGRYATITTH